MLDLQQYRVPRNVIAGIAITFLLILGAVTAWLIPLPILYYRVKLGRKISLIIPAVVILILTWVSKEFSPGLIVFSGWMFLGYLLSECFEMKLSIEKTIIYTSLAVLMSGALALLFYSNISQTGIYDLAYRQVTVFLGYLVDAGLIAETPDDVKHMVTWMLPGMVTTMVAFVSWVNVVLAIPLLKRNQLPCPEYGMLDQWKAPEKMIWVTIAATLGILVDSKPLFLLSMNVMCLVFVVYFLQGISIVSFFVKMTRIPGFLRYLLYWLVFFQFPVNLIVTGLGLFDMWVDFRTLISRMKKNDAGD